jgi:hypothetical protein
VAALAYALALRIKRGGGWQWRDGFLAAMGLAAFVYLFLPDKLFGGSLFVVRAQYVWGVFAACCIGYVLTRRVRDAVGVALFACFVWLSVPRMACMSKAAAAVAEIVSAGQYIQPKAVVLPLDFEPGGLSANGRAVTDRNWLFVHAWQYMGADKPMILLDNYEANTGYFPLTWKPEVNPYLHLCHNGEMEAQPPSGSLDSFTRATGVRVDYVLLWCYDEQWRADAGFARLWGEISGGYHVVYRSRSGRVALYARSGAR